MKLPNWLRKLLALLKLGHDAGLYQERGSPAPRGSTQIERPADLRDRRPV